MPSEDKVSNGKGFNHALASSLLFDGGSYLLGESIHLVGLHVDMMAEIEVAGIVERHEVDVSMRHINAHDGDTDLDAWANLLEARGNTTAEAMKVDKKVIVEVENIVDLLLGDAKDMTPDYRIDIEKSEEIFGLGDFVAGNLASNDA